MHGTLALWFGFQEVTADSTSGAEGGASGGLATVMQFVPFLLMGVIFWFMLIAPERKARKKREEMLKQLEKGAKVMTTGGLFGTIANLTDDQVTLQVDDGVRLRFARSAIQSVVDEVGGSDKNDKK